MIVVETEDTGDMEVVEIDLDRTAELSSEHCNRCCHFEAVAAKEVVAVGVDMALYSLSFSLLNRLLPCSHLHVSPYMETKSSIGSNGQSCYIDYSNSIMNLAVFQISLQMRR